MLHKLPDDSGHWPEDPFKLLGIDSHADLHSAKRAYISLIKRYRPDKAPAEFKKVHAAFEFVRDYISLRRTSNHPHESMEKIPDGPISQDSLTFSAPIPTEIFDPFLSALECGEIDLAISLLRSMESNTNRQIRSRSDLMLYCLLDLFAPSMPREPLSENAVETLHAIDQFESPSTPLHENRISHLLKSLESDDLFYSAINALMTEFDENPPAAIFSNVTSSLQTLACPETMFGLLQLRWRAVANRNLQLVLDDFQALEPKSLSIGPVWGQILVESLEYTLWSADPDFKSHNEKCLRELSQNYLDLFTDDLELLLLAAKEWENSIPEPQNLKMTPHARTLLPQSHRRLWFEIAESIAANPAESLDSLTQYSRRSPYASMVFQQGLRRYSELLISDWNLHHDEETDNDAYHRNLREQIACFFQYHDGSDYKNCRKAVLEFCLSQRLHPMEFGFFATTFQDSEDYATWSQLIFEDISLHSVFYAAV